MIKLGSTNESFQYLEGAIDSYPADGVQSLHMSHCHPVQDPGAGEDQDPAIWLPWILVDQTLRIWLGTQFSQPTPELGPLQAEF